MSGGGAPVEVSVLVDDGHLEQIDSLAAALRGAGLQVNEVLDGLGVITGVADDPTQLEGLDGVKAVEIGRTVQLPPPESPIQ